MQFVDFAPVKLVFGPGRLEALRTEPLPGTRALLLTSNGRSMERIGALARVTAILEERGVAVVHMGVVEPNPMVSTVMKVAARMKPASRQKITQSPETKQTLLLKALFNRGFFLAPRWVHMI